MTTLAKAGRYQILDEIGRGAMGVVYRAQDPVIGREVAVKTMHLTQDGESASRPEFISRFQTEARAAGILTHPNIVVVFDAGEEEGIFYITMELVAGRSLQTLLDERQIFPVTRAIHILEQACGALEYSHRHNIVHRDIKPANLMVTDNDVLKITDFGTAKIMRFNTAQTSHIIGTPSYMSPEQIKGKPVDGRADIFALGVIFYELLTGEKPFPGQNITTVIYKIVNEEPVPPRKIDPSIHPGLAAIIARALAKEPTARFQSCGEMLAALKNYKSFGPSDPQATILTSPQNFSGMIQPLASMPSRSISLPEVSRVSPAPAQGHTIYEPERQKPSAFVTFLFSLLLIGVICGTGYFIWPYTYDVWQGVRGAMGKQTGAGNSSAPAPIAPVTAPPVTLAKPKTPTPQNGKAATSLENIQKTKPSVTPAPVKNPTPAVDSTGDVATPPTAGAAAVQPPSNPVIATAQPKLTVEELKSRIEQKLANAGMSSRVQINLAGSSLVLEGRLHPAEHNALVNQLRQMPGWDKVTDDIAYDDTPITTPAGSGAAATAGTATITVNSDPPGAAILVNGELQPERTPATVSIAPGKYNVVLRKADFAPYPVQVDAKQGQTSAVAATLMRRKSPEGSSFGFVNVNSTPEGAEIRVDGAATGQHTPAQLELSAGDHAIAVWYQGKRLTRQDVTVKANQVMQVTASAQQP